jgi:hypothetical protein
MTDWTAFLTELTRVAKHAVLFDYAEVCSLNFMAPYLFGLKKHLEPNTRRFHCFRKTELVRALEQAEFNRIERFPQYFLPMMLHRRINHAEFSSAAEKVFRWAGLTGLFGSPVIIKAERDSGDIA